MQRGTMFAVRGQKLYDLYKSRAGLDDITGDERTRLEKDVFRKIVSSVWMIKGIFIR